MARRALILIEGEILGPTLLYVQSAKHLWLQPIILSAYPAQFDYLVAKGIEAIRVATNDFESLIDECSRLRATYDIAGITSSEEEGYATVGKLCRYFDLPGPNPTSIERC